MRRHRWQIGYTMFLLVILILGFFYERHVDSVANQLALRSCLQQNLHRKAHNQLVVILKEIMVDVAERNENQAVLATDPEQQETLYNISDEWRGYALTLHRVPVAQCRKFYAR